MKTFFKRKWQTLVLFMLIFSVLAFVFSVVQTQKYRSEQRFLVVSEYAEDVDPYAATRSTEYLTNLLSEVIYSQDFLDRVLGAGYALEKNMFPRESKERKEEWLKTISARVLADTGMLDVTVYHENRYITEQLALAVGEVIQTEHPQYHSRGGQVTIQTIDAPVTSLRPVQPNILLNTSVGLVLGLISGLAFVYLFPNREFSFTGEKGEKPVSTMPDFSKSFAESSAQTQERQAVKKPSMYESSEMKYPTKRAKTEYGQKQEQATPPENLPIG